MHRAWDGQSPERYSCAKDSRSQERNAQHSGINIGPIWGNNKNKTKSKKKKRKKKVQLEIRELAPLPIFRMLSWHPDFLKQKLIQRHRGKYSAVHIAFLNINNASSSFGKKFGNLSYMWFRWNLPRLNMQNSWHLKNTCIQGQEILKIYHLHDRGNQKLWSIFKESQVDRLTIFIWAFVSAVGLLWPEAI